MSLYRKYRPKTLDDLVGQDHITDILRAQAKAQTFSQNYLLCGTRGAGKTSSARLIAKLVNSSVLD
jgi:DNA polymerase-3 subunit gamma/tau